MTTIEELKAKRDKKALPHLEQYAPVWIIDEQVFVEEEAIQFNVLLQHNTHGWLSRRYRYDGFNNTLYHKGQTMIAEDVAVDHMDDTPYIEATVTDIPNSYGG